MHWQHPLPRALCWHLPRKLLLPILNLSVCAAAGWTPAQLDAFAEDLDILARRGGLSVKATLRCGEMATPMEMVRDGRAVLIFVGGAALRWQPAHGAPLRMGGPVGAGVP